MAESKVTTMVLKVDLQCTRCYHKIKKLLCRYHEIRDHLFDEKQNTVTITVICCTPERIRQKLICRGGKSIKSIEILQPKKPPPPAAAPAPEKQKPPAEKAKPAPAGPKPAAAPGEPKEKGGPPPKPKEEKGKEAAPPKAAGPPPKPKEEKGKDAGPPAPEQGQAAAFMAAAPGYPMEYYMPPVYYREGYEVAVRPLPPYSYGGGAPPCGSCGGHYCRCQCDYYFTEENPPSCSVM